MSKLKKYRFYTIMLGDEFLSSNIMKGRTEKITECIRFATKEEAEEHFQWLRKDLDFRIAEVRCKVYVQDERRMLNDA